MTARRVTLQVRGWRLRCSICGRSFTARRLDAKTCSPRCRKALSRKHLEEGK